MRTRILHIIPTLDQAGAEKQLGLLCRHLGSEFDVHVCALTRGGPLARDLAEAGVPVTILGKRWKGDPQCFVRLCRLIKRLKPDIVQTWLFAAGAYGRAAARCAEVPHLVHTERCVDRWKASWQWIVDRRLANCTDRLVGNSPAVRDYAISHGMPAARYTVIANGIDPPEKSRLSRPQFCQDIRVGDDAYLIGTVGRLWPQKRIDDLIWAYELVASAHPQARLVIFGDGPLLRKLERFAHLVSDLRRVIFMGHRSDAASLLPHFDLYWQGSGYEGMPNAVMEAMAANIPVIATDIPSHREIISSGESGLLVPVSDRAALGRATHRLMEDPGLARQIATTGYHHVMDKFSTKQMVAAYELLYHELLNAGDISTSPDKVPTESGIG